ncbi:MAG: carbonic anhydrase [Phycisphaerales bacterium]|jgi:carbonic anhydrase|nr:carbonic anhydrase [Phycisphaerales bacterium]
MTRTHLSLAALIVALGGSAIGGPGATPVIAPSDVYDLLRSGNQRWIDGSCEDRNTDSERRADTAQNGQHPFACVITCADSRIPVERVFDRGVGDLFVIRVAGNVASPSVLGSVEYAVDHLATPVVLFMGHTGCGAVGAACAEGEMHGNIATLIDSIRPVVKEAKACAAGEKSSKKDEASQAAIVAEAVRLNVEYQIRASIEESPVIAQAVADGRTRVVGAIYDLASGEIRWLDEQPDLRDLAMSTLAPKQPEVAQVEEKKPARRTGFSPNTSGGATPRRVTTALDRDEH